jgi:tetratricopeptide (TPR) repeat protein
VKNNLAWLYANHAGNLDVALKLAEEAKEAAPDNPTVTDTLAWIYVKKGTLEPAVRFLKECLEKTPGDANCRYHLGVAYYQSGEMPQAKQSLQAALAKLPASDADDARKLLTTIGNHQ